MDCLAYVFVCSLVPFRCQARQSSVDGREAIRRAAQPPGSFFPTPLASALSRRRDTLSFSFPHRVAVARIELIEIERRPSCPRTPFPSTRRVPPARSPGSSIRSTSSVFAPPSESRACAVRPWFRTPSCSPRAGNEGLSGRLQQLRKRGLAGLCEGLAQHLEQRETVGLCAVPFVEKAVAVREVFEFRAFDAGFVPRHFLPRATPRQRAEDRQARLEEVAIETGVVRNDEPDPFEQAADGRIVETLAAHHVVRNAVNRRRLGWNGKSRILEGVVPAEHATDERRFPRSISNTTTASSMTLSMSDPCPSFPYR